MSHPGPAPLAHPRRERVGPHQPLLREISGHDLGEGRLEPGMPNGRPQRVLRVDVTGAPPNLLGRVLAGSYITGHDQVIVSARNGLSESQRRELHAAVDRILGMTVVADTSSTVEIQNFIDPGKYELPRLMHRVVQMLRAELEVCHAALTDDESPQLTVIDTIEQEVDRLYLLMVRQLLLSSESARIAHDIDVESHHYQIGDRLVAKMLELIGDLVHGIGAELEEHLRGIRRLPLPVVHEIAARVERLERLLTRSMDAFGHLSIVEANATLNVIDETLPRDARSWHLTCHDITDRRVGVAAQRITFNLDMALELLIVVNEVTINRSVEPRNEIPPALQVLVHGRKPFEAAGSSDTSIAILSETTRKPSAFHA